MSQGTADAAAVVVIDRVAAAVGALLLNVTVDGLKLQLDCAGKPEHALADKVIVPLNPFVPVNASVAVAEPPGDATRITDGVTVKPKVGPVTPTVTGLDADVR